MSVLEKFAMVQLHQSILYPRQLSFQLQCQLYTRIPFLLPRKQLVSIFPFLPEVVSLKADKRDMFYRRFQAYRDQLFCGHEMLRRE